METTTEQGLGQVNNKIEKRKRWRGDKRQRSFMQYWLEPSSPTFSNAYRSALKAGYSNSYALHITGVAPDWLSEYMQMDEMLPDHIRQGVQSLAKAAPNSKSPDDTRLKAYELLAKITGLLDGKGTNITVVTPILGGQSVDPLPKKVDVEVDKPSR